MEEPSVYKYRFADTRMLSIECNILTQAFLVLKVLKYDHGLTAACLVICSYIYSNRIRPSLAGPLRTSIAM